MGKATTLIGVYLLISLFASMFVLGLQAVDPNSPILASNALVDTNFNIVYGELDTSGDTWVNSHDYSGDLPTREATGEASSTSTQFPDWTFSSLNWIRGVGSVLLNVIGAPYTIAMLISNTSAGATVGTAFSILSMFIIVGWILGKID